MRNREFLKHKFPNLFERLDGLKKLQSTARSGALISTSRQGVSLSKSNTTILAILCKDCAVLAGDRRTSAGFEIISDSTQKIHQFSEFSGIGMAGRCVSSRETVEEMHHIFETFESNAGAQLTLDGQAKVLQNFVKYFYWSSLTLDDDQYIGSVLAGFDAEWQRPRIFSVYLDGVRSEESKFAGVGCGFLDVKQLLERKWRNDLSETSGIRLIIEALAYSGKASSGVSDVRISPPNVAVIDKKGFRWVPEKNVISIANKLLQTEVRHEK